MSDAKKTEEERRWGSGLDSFFIKTIKKDNKGDCIIHYCGSNEPLTTLPSSNSWKNLLQAAEIRRDERILRLKEVLKDGEFPKLQYHLQLLTGQVQERISSNSSRFVLSWNILICIHQESQKTKTMFAQSKASSLQHLKARSW